MHSMSPIFFKWEIWAVGGYLGNFSVCFESDD